MQFVSSFYCLLLFITQTQLEHNISQCAHRYLTRAQSINDALLNPLLQNSTLKSIDNIKLRRKWPDIRFEDFYQNSGDGPNEENDTESYLWTTIVTQVKASIWPTVTRIKISTPLPKTTRYTDISLTPVFPEFSDYLITSLAFVSFGSYSSLSQSILARSSVEYLGPSSTITVMTSPNLIMESVWFSVSDMKITPSSVLEISPSFSSAERDVYVSNYENNSGFGSSVSQSYLVIASASLLSAYELSRQIETPLLSPSVTFSTVNRIPVFNTIDLLSSKSIINIEMRETPTLSSFPKLTTTEPISYLLSTTVIVSLTTISSSMTSSQSPTLTPTTSIKETHTSTSTSSPLCPEVPHIEPPKRLEKPFEDYLIRTVLNNTGNETLADIKIRVEGNIRQIYIYAYGKQFEAIAGHRSGRQLLQSTAQHINASIDVKIWEITSENGSQQIHVIYYLEKNGTLIAYEDALRTLSHISDDNYSKMIGMDVIDKVKPYNERKVMQLAAKSEINLLGIILIACSAVLFIICIIASIVIVCKYRAEKRKWMDSFHMELNRVEPDNRVQWRTVSETVTEAVTDRQTNDNSEFQYLPFQSLQTMTNNARQTKAMTASKGVQSNLEMRKEKVVAIAQIIDDSDHVNHMNELNTTYVTTKQIDIPSYDRVGPRVSAPQMSDQTQSIIRAIRKELRKFSPSSASIVLHANRCEGSTISDVSKSSEA